VRSNKTHPILCVMPKYPKFKRYNIETAIYMPPVDSTNAVVCALLLPDSIPHAATIGTKEAHLFNQKCTYNAGSHKPHMAPM